MGNGSRRRIKTHQLGELTIQTEVSCARAVPEHKLLMSQMIFHSSQKSSITGINHRCGGVVRANHIKTTNLAFCHPLFELVMAIFGQTYVKAIGQQRACVVRI